MNGRLATYARGFTLLEMLVALIIAALLVSLVPGALSAAIPGQRLKAAVGDFASALESARRRAIYQGRPIDVLVDAATASYVIGESTTVLPDGARLRPRRAFVSPGAEGHLPLTGTEAVVLRFYPDSSTTGGVVSVSQGNREFVVTVNWLTGDVDVNEERYDETPRS